MSQLKNKIESITYKGEEIKGRFIKDTTEMFFRSKQGDLYMKIAGTTIGFLKWEKVEFKKWKPNIFLSKRQ